MKPLHTWKRFPVTQRRLVRVVTAVVVCSLSLVLRASEPREYPCHRLDDKPVIDGKLGDAAWQRLPEAAGFHLLKSDAFAIEKQTWFRAGWTEDALYLAIRCEEPKPTAMKALAKDGGALWSDDSLELLFVPGGKAPCFHLVVNSEGARWNGIKGEDEQKLWDWQAAAHVGGGGWSVEARIPFVVLRKTPLEGEKWRVNIARNITTGPSAEKHTSWLPALNGFRDVEQFGSLVFGGAQSSSQATAQAERKINAGYHAFLKQCCGDASRPACRSALVVAMKNPALAKDAAVLKKTVDWMQNLSLQGAPNPKHLLLANTRYRVQKRVVAEKAEALGIEIDGVTPKVTKLSMRFELKTRDADAILYVNGKKATPGPDGFSADLREGLNVVAVSAVSRGKRPGVGIRIADHPETDGRWRVGTNEDEGWLNATFDDQAWPVVSVPKDGLMWGADDGQACFRQVLLWNEAHDGPNRCLNPLIKEWGFSERSVETLFLALYSPLPFPLDDFEFVLDLPEGFRLMDKMTSIHRPYNCRPESIVIEPVERDEQPHTRHRLLFRTRDVRHDRYHVSLLPVYLDERIGEETGRFTYWRRARGNFTELKQILPIRKLPPINGRMPEKVMISQYASIPWGSGYPVYFTREHLNAHISQSLRAGLNYWILSGRYKRESLGDRYRELVYQKLVEGGAHIVMWPVFNHPIYGARDSTLLPGRLLSWLRDRPEAQARYWQDSRPWEEKGRHGGHGMFCPSYVNTAAADEFWAIVKNDYENMLATMPEAEIIFNDWESWPWVKGGPYGQTVLDGEGSWCFCKRCKEGFRQFANLPADADLSDAAILKNHEKDWVKYRARLYGGIHARIRDVCHELDKPYMFYSWSAHTTLWRELRGKIDIAFPGLPGNGAMNASRQKSIDDRMRDLFQRDVGLKRVMGQRFSFHVSRAQPDGWKKWSVMSEDGYVHPKSWKSQTLRLVASVHGGIDFQNSTEYVGGSLYYIGEATRIISEFEHLFWDGERADDLAESAQIKYPNLLVLKKGAERLVLLFNEGVKPLTVQLQNKDLKPDQKGTIHGAPISTDTPAEMKVTIPPEDVVVVHIK
ncbi:MAG: hypothetical protein KAI66_01570 [Lentisphaeria bacterium]|nr:hypothetical protein [Lentisphaeria bacterium]